MVLARTSLSPFIDPYHVSLSAGVLNNILCPHRAVVGKFFLVSQHTRSCDGVHQRTSLLCLSLLLQQGPTCFVCIILMVLVMGGKWPYSCCFVVCCLLTLFTIDHSILCCLRLAFPLYVLLASRWCLITIVLTQPLFGRNPTLYYRIDKTSIWSIAYR